MVEIVPASGHGRGDGPGEEADAGVSVEHREECSAVCRWVIPGFSKLKQRTTRCLWSRYFEVGGYDCRLLVYPTGAASFFMSPYVAAWLCHACIWISNFACPRINIFTTEAAHWLIVACWLLISYPVIWIVPWCMCTDVWNHQIMISLPASHCTTAFSLCVLALSISIGWKHA